MVIGKLFFLISLTTPAYAGWFGASFNNIEDILAEHAKNVALTYMPTGVKVEWKNPATGAFGYSMILFDYPLTMSGDCKLLYEWKSDKDAYQVEEQATYCFQRNRGWVPFSRPY
jgi:hypothetical protein